MKHPAAPHHSNNCGRRTSISRNPIFAATLLAAALALAPLPRLWAQSPNSRLKTTPGSAVRSVSSMTTDGTAAVGAAGTGAGTEAAPTALGVLDIDLAQVKRIKVAGQLIDETPIRVGNLDVLAPIVGDNSSILQGLGASASQLAAQNAGAAVDGSFQINLPSGAPLVLTIGKATVKIDNAEQSLRAAPLVMKGKIWLPIFSLAPLMGAATRLQADGTLYINPTVQSVELFPAKGYTVLTVKLSAPPDKAPSLGTLDDPPKVYLDFEGYSMGFDALYSTTERTVGNGLNEVEQVRAGMFQKFPDTTRVVLDLKKDMRAVLQPLPDKSIIALMLLSPGAVTPAVDNTTPVVYPSSSGLRGYTIVVDAGHGGYDSGAPGAKSYEKNHTLEISRLLRDNLRRRGANVLMSRDSDNFISLQGRVDFANSHKADIFFSVHIDSFKATSTGSTTHYYTSQSLSLAREVQKELAKATGLHDRGVKQSRFFVIRKTTMPSVLTESCFITNPHEEALLLDPAWKARLAAGMAQGIANYIAKYHPHNAVNQ